MKVLVCGSRDWPFPSHIDTVLRGLAREDPDMTVIHGACSRRIDGEERSADMLADRFARRLGLSVDPHPADWERHGKRAGIVRNLEMLDEEPELVLAFQSKRSRGTQHTIDEARRRGIQTLVWSA